MRKKEVFVIIIAIKDVNDRSDDHGSEGIYLIMMMTVMMVVIAHDGDDDSGCGGCDNDSNAVTLSFTYLNNYGGSFAITTCSTHSRPQTIKE